MARHNTEAQKAEDAERQKNDPPGSVGAAKVPQPEPEAPKPLKRAEPTDDQLADIFAEEHRNDLRYVAAWGKWFEWTGKLWREDLTLRHFDLMRRTCKAQGVKRAGMANWSRRPHAGPRRPATRRDGRPVGRRSVVPQHAGRHRRPADRDRSQERPTRLHDQDRRGRAARRIVRCSWSSSPDHGRRRCAGRLLQRVSAIA